MTRTGNQAKKGALQQRTMSPQAKLTASWSSLMFLVIYVDYFHLYQPGAISEIASGLILNFPISGALMSLFFVIIAIPAVMVLLSTTLPARANRITNLAVASSQVIIMGSNGAEAPSGFAFYYVLTIGVEVLILFYILRTAWTWPRTSVDGADNATVDRLNQETSA